MLSGVLSFVGLFLCCRLSEAPSPHKQHDVYLIWMFLVRGVSRETHRGSRERPLAGFNLEPIKTHNASGTTYRQPHSFAIPALHTYIYF